MACELKLRNDTPTQLWRVPWSTYQIRATLSPTSSSGSSCEFRDERVVAIVNGIPFPMTRVYPSSQLWQCTVSATVSFTLLFRSKYRVRSFRWFPFSEREVYFPRDGRPIQVAIVAPPHVSVSPTELLFYFDDMVPNTDKKATLHNGMLTSVMVSNVTIKDVAESLGGAGGSGYFSLVSPPALPLMVSPGTSHDFIVRFLNSRMTREAQLVIETSQGKFLVGLHGKYML